ncbi:MAG: hypothetical protein KKI02_06105 [Planctomycetes bacterium]|nr:hypothetical protein [Planctomycetota bacterium]
MPSTHCKQSGRPPRAARLSVVRVLLPAILWGLGGLSACGTHTRPQVVSVHALENAPFLEPSVTRRAIVSDTAQLRELYYPLGQRLGLFQIRSAEQWEALRHQAPELGPAPDFDGGIVVGLASHAGLPLDGTWPIHLQTVRGHNGAGFATGCFQGGSFLPDGTTFLEAAQFDGLAAVLIVEVNGTRFYPE